MDVFPVQAFHVGFLPFGELLAEEFPVGFVEDEWGVHGVPWIVGGRWKKKAAECRILQVVFFKLRLFGAMEPGAYRFPPEWKMLKICLFSFKLTNWGGGAESSGLRGGGIRQALFLERLCFFGRDGGKGAARRLPRKTPTAEKSGKDGEKRSGMRVGKV